MGGAGEGKAPGGGGPSPGSLQPCSPRCALTGAVTTDGAECLPTGGVQRARLPDHRCVGDASGRHRGWMRGLGLLRDRGVRQDPERVEGSCLFLQWAPGQVPGWGGGQLFRGRRGCARGPLAGPWCSPRLRAWVQPWGGAFPADCWPSPRCPSAHRPPACPSSGALPQPGRAGPLAVPPGKADGPHGGAAALQLGAPTGQCREPSPRLSSPSPLPALTPLYQGPPEDALPWTLQRRLTQQRTASGRQAVGSAICASRVKLQHLPSQVGGGGRG